MSAYVPPGWPSGVHPPGSEDFERTAQAWLLDVVPPDYRLHGVLRRYPLALAAMAAHHAQACVAGAREGYRNARTEVGGALPPHALEALLAAYRAEGRRLVATAEAVDLVARALRGEVFTPQLQDAARPGGQRQAPGSGVHDQPATAQPAASAATERQAAQRPLPEQPAAAQQPLRERPAAAQQAAGQPVTQQPAEQKAPGRPGKARKAPAPAQRPARNGGASTRKTKRDQHAAAS
jgi:hypothetical protein